MNTPKPDEATEYRQAHCDHKFAKGVADAVAWCVHCGLPEDAYAAPPTGWHV